MEELLPCPFCGAEPTLVSDFKPGRNGCQTAMVRCYNCHSDGYIADSCMDETEQDAIARWNTRATDPDNSYIESMHELAAKLEVHKLLMEEMAGVLEELVAKVSHGMSEYDTRIKMVVKAKRILQEYRESKP